MKGEYILGDCMEYLGGYADNHFDLAIVDPPYGIGESKKKRDSIQNGTWTNPLPSPYIQKDWDNKRPTKEYFKELIRVSKNQIIWGGNYFVEYLKPSMGWIFWDKKVTGDFSKGELAYTSYNRALLKFEWLWSGYKKQKPEKRIHPTQKPVALYRWLLQNYAKPNDLILDTHVGSASSLIACEIEGFKYVGFEKDSDYYQQSTKRIKQHLAQKVLF